MVETFPRIKENGITFTLPEVFIKEWEARLENGIDETELSKVLVASKPPQINPNMTWLHDRLLMHLAGFKPDKNSDGYIRC